ncbi:uncharacterized protein AKAME5_002612200 [Lates japonicus]|uniref:Uncharacterized protein n=1 Tax=Lates japonicus TaxID=270547 RepID=A0AAD3RNU1_LATJO|nr:uncharacterized protein AKAME5_002612200 [Lates japonicus]
MAFSRPLIFEEHLLRGVAPELDDNRADGHQLMDIDGGEDWSDGADSGYGSTTEDEEDLHVEDVRYRSPLVQQLQPDGFGRIGDGRVSCSLLAPSLPLFLLQAHAAPQPKPEEMSSSQASATPRRGAGRRTTRSSEDDYRNSAPSTSGLGFFAGRRRWPDPFGYPRWAEDGYSD